MGFKRKTKNWSDLPEWTCDICGKPSKHKFGCSPEHRKQSWKRRRLATEEEKKALRDYYIIDRESFYTEINRTEDKDK